MTMLPEERARVKIDKQLYQQIQAEKQALIKAGKIKKEKPLSEITADEIPFEIPANWKWVRLSDISKKITDGTHNSPINTQEGEFMYVTAKNIKDEGVVLDGITYVTKSVHEEIYTRCSPEKGDVLLIKDEATTGIVTVNNLSEPFSMLSSVALIKPMPCIEPWYIAYAMRSSWFYRYIRNEMTGVGMTRVVLKQIQSFAIPLPPLAEQKRIVAKLEEVLRATGAAAPEPPPPLWTTPEPPPPPQEVRGAQPSVARKAAPSLPQPPFARR